MIDWYYLSCNTDKLDSWILLHWNNSVKAMELFEENQEHIDWCFLSDNKFINKKFG